MNCLSIHINGQIAYEYPRDTQLADEQHSFLDRMDSDMNRGIRLYGELIACPDAEQRAMFITMNLVRALQQANEAIISASCAWLVERNPGLTEVQIKDGEDRLIIEFVNDNDMPRSE